MAPASAGCSTAPTRRCTGRKPPAPVWSSPTCRRTNPSRTGPPPGCGTAAHRPARRTHRATDNPGPMLTRAPGGLRGCPHARRSPAPQRPPRPRPAAAGMPMPVPSPSQRSSPVLSFDTTHAITGCLLEADAATHGFHGPPVLLLLHDRPLTPAGPGRLRQIRAVAFTLHPHDVAEHTQGIPGVLTDLAACRAATDADAATDAIAYPAPG